MARKRRRRSDAANNSVFLPMELITEILSLLNVKAIVRFKCVSKSWNNLTSDSNFVDKHLKVSSRNPHLTLTDWHLKAISVHRLLKNPSAIGFPSPYDDFHRMIVENSCRCVGSCNGLLCFVSCKPKALPFKYLLHISNPATRTISQNFEFTFGRDFRFTFGYDASTRTYKVVALRAKLDYSEVKVFNLGVNCWKNIHNFPISGQVYQGVHFYGTINWLTLDKSINHVDQFVIVSLDLSTETYKQFLLPALGVDHMPIYQPTLRVLMDSLCFSHSNKTEFILWKMEEYGVQESWTQLFKINYQYLEMQLRVKLSMHNNHLACLYVNGDIVIFANGCKQSFIYNIKYKTVVEIKSSVTRQFLSNSEDYVESLVSVH